MTTPTKRGASATSWKPGQSGNPAGRPAGAEKVRQLLEPKRAALVKKAIELAMGGDAVVMRALLDRLAPVPRSQHEAVAIPGLADATTLTAKASAVMDAMGRAEVTPDAAAMILGALSSACQIAEFDDLQRRLLALEQRDQ